MQAEAVASGSPCSADGTIDLSFGGIADRRQGCATWVTEDGVAAAPNCVALIRAEQRFGNGDHLYTGASSARASDALYNTIRGDSQLHRGSPPYGVRSRVELLICLAAWDASRCRDHRQGPAGVPSFSS